jgi:hypothetical protein
VSHEQGVCGDGQELALSAAVILDPRLAEIWQLVWAASPYAAYLDAPACSFATLGALLRLAYVQGYADAMTEERSGSLFEELGLRRPEVVSRPPSSRSRPMRDRAKRDSSDR